MAGALGGVVADSQDNAGKTTNNVKLTTISLISLLLFFKEPTIIDYMSLDVEGGEWDALIFLISAYTDLKLYQLNVQ
jgi:hypothetical protein